MKWEKTAGFIWQCIVPMVLAAKLGGSMERSGLKKLCRYRQGNSENLQHSDQANSGFRCAIYTQRPCVAKHLGEEKPFTQSSAAGRTRNIIINLLLVPVRFWDALGTEVLSRQLLSVLTALPCAILPPPALCYHLGNTNCKAEAAQQLSARLKT